MKNNKIDVYYGIELKNITTKDIKSIEDEILRNKDLKELSYYSRNNIKVPYKLSDNEKTIEVALDNSKNTTTYICKDVEYKRLIDITKDYLIVPKFYEENFDINLYKNKLTSLEHSKDKLKNEIFEKYNKKFNKIFNVYEGLNGVYEWYTGGVYFKDYEWEEIKNNKIKDIFMKTKDSYYIYSLPLDNGVLLRSSDIYYYFSTDVSRYKKPTLKQVRVWYDNCIKFIDEVLKALKTYRIKDNYDKRLILGVIDNIRNIVLIMFNAELLTVNKGKNFIIDISFNEDKIINSYVGLVNKYIEIINNITIRDDTNATIKDLSNILKDLKKISTETIDKVASIKDAYLRSKCFNPLREIDNYMENYIVCEEAFKKIPKNKDINLIGVLYGGLELPFIIKSIYKEVDINISFIYQNYGMYLDRQNKTKQTLNNDLIEIGNLNKNNITYLVDDNMMSGITMQFVYNQLIVRGFNKINGMIIIRHPNINRLPQLVYFRTAVNLDKVDNMIFGMITDTPYSKIKYNTNYNNMFVNELNIFSIMTEVFLKALYRNNSFIKDSQVDIFLGYSEGKK